ncbi:hypothetical protein FSW04_08220 [Baekduia soli]|uniref:Uncharacterized protein n=1 Tax=Baekduia soli TaxID=496014 RepID=A0A5B8U3D8_9ACTN|nr:hypothetical protein [Baekduia soli]QEC47564.1 hypothetical protein FSW04_08220 [Baekduia soli]
MSDGARTVPATEVRPGDRITARAIDLTVTRIDRPFLGRDEMLAFVEDSDVQWIKVPVALDAEVVLRD